MTAEAASTVVDVGETSQHDPSAVTSLDRLDPLPNVITLEGGIRVNVLPLRTRQFFKLLRIVTRGGSNVLHTINLSSDQTDEAFASQLIGLTVFAIPEAEEEAVTFIKAMTEAVDPAEAERLEAELDNPELEDTVAILEAVLRRESSDLKALGKRLTAMFRTAEKVGAVKTAKKKTDRSSEDTPGSSTS